MVSSTLFSHNLTVPPSLPPSPQICKRTFIAVMRNPATSIFQILSFLVPAHNPTFPPSLPSSLPPPRSASVPSLPSCAIRPPPSCRSSPSSLPPCCWALSFTGSSLMARPPCRYVLLPSLPPSFPPSFRPFSQIPPSFPLPQAHIGFLFMVSYMIIFSAITSLELFIQERSLFVHEKTSG